MWSDIIESLGSSPQSAAVLLSLLKTREAISDQELFFLIDDLLENNSLIKTDFTGGLIFIDFDAFTFLGPLGIGSH